ncbi:LysR substrate-binding domain-containing protein [Salipiger sp.]|uniref:LysR substrate-binding domain-containing protein n=1 Tax=Salipiger sp. TaxID=2078585 RepID=UPI003A96D650
MDTRRLEAFTKVVDLGSVTRAASVLHIAQPALSQQIISLEGEFRVQLLNRSTRGVTPTEAGKVLYRYAKTIMRQVDEARRGVLEQGGELTGSVSVGLAGWSSASLLGPRLIAEVHEHHPGIRLQICDSFLIRLSEMVLNGQLDMAVLYGDHAARGLNYIAVGEESFRIAAPPGLLPEGVEVIDHEALAALPLVMPIRESFARLMVERACETVGRAPDITVEVFSCSNLIAALEAGCGATVVPVEVAESLAARTELEIRPLHKDMRMPMSMCIPDSEGLSDAAFAVYQIMDRLVRGRPAMRGAA